VILFGSQATGRAEDSSDIDLCIVTNGETRKLDVSRQVRRALYDEVHAPLDVLVYSQEELTARARELKSIERSIVEEGIPLFG
jgi:predicted nucleotidyltransferase